MPLEPDLTHEQMEVLITDLHGMSTLFRDQPMSKDQLREYCSDLRNYYGFAYPFNDLRKAIRLARQRYEPRTGVTMPYVKFIMDMINPKA